MLSLHLVGAGASLLLVIAGGWHLLQGRASRWLLWAVPVAVIWQFVTGVGLVVEGASLLRMCGSGIAYLLVLGGLEYGLLRQRRLHHLRATDTAEV